MKPAATLILVLLISGCGVTNQSLPKPSMSQSEVHSSTPARTVTNPITGKPVILPRNVAVASASRVSSIAGETTFVPRSLSFTSSAVGWAWGPSPSALKSGIGPGVLSKTDNYGNSWKQVATAGINVSTQGSDNNYEYANGVRFVDAKLGFLFGSAFYVTTDGGSSWDKVSSPGTIYDIEAGGGRILALINNCGISVSCGTASLYQISNDGQLIQKVSSSPVFSWQAQLLIRGPYTLVFTPPTIAGGGPYKIWRLLSGRSWKSIYTPCEFSGSLTAALAAWSESGLALVCGSPPGSGEQIKTAYSSSDAGKTWSKGKVIGSLNGYVTSLAAANSNTWILGQDRGDILATHDGGKTWIDLPIAGRGGGTGQGWGSVGFVDPSQAFAVPYTVKGSYLAFSSDGAQNWTMVNFPNGGTIDSKK
ncbi:MAG: hypothetical protein M0Z45_04435 [Actinomycetota bacterium]|nr:hypothetical protein [Actinomycetota bacterium]